MTPDSEPLDAFLGHISIQTRTAYEMTRSPRCRGSSRRRRRFIPSIP